MKLGGGGDEFIAGMGIVREGEQRGKEDRPAGVATVASRVLCVYGMCDTLGLAMVLWRVNQFCPSTVINVVVDAPGNVTRAETQ